MTKHLNTNRILIFLAFAFGIPWTAALVVYLSGMSKSSPVQAISLTNTVFILTPWLANIAARLITKEGWGNMMLRPNFKRGWKFYLGVWLLPILATTVGAVAFYLLFPESFDPNLGVLATMLKSNPASAGLNPWMIFPLTIISVIFITTPINMVASMGEEFGWRAYLLPKLLNRFAGDDGAQESSFHAADARKAALLTGVIHGVWHWPLLYMGLSLTPGATVFTPVVYLLFTCAMSVLISWAVIRSGSVWPAALGHGAVNGVSALPGYLLKGAPIPLLGPDPTGLIGGIGYTIVALVLLFSRKAFAGGKESSPAQVEPHPTMA